LESIVTKQKANSNWNIYIPYWDTNWKVSIDDTVVQNWWSSTSFSWYVANSEHIVAIEPITVSYWRAKNYKWYNKTGNNLVIEIIQDKSYIWFADSATDTWTYFRRDEYSSCTQLINTAEEYLPDTVTTIGTNFRYRQYKWCSKITEAPEEVLPDTVTSIWTAYRYEQFYNCTSLTSIKWWKDSSYGWTNYRYYQFYGSNAQKTVKVLSDVWYNAQANALTNTYVTEVQVPTAYLSNFVNSNNYPRINITDSKFVWY
jgi:hypothetical protein